MKSHDFYYIICNFGDNSIFSCGASFHDFMNYIDSQPNYLLLLNASFGDGDYCAQIGLDRVDSKNIEALIHDDVANYGDFVWVDYNNPKTVQNMTPIQLAELLYLRHTFQPLNQPFIHWLENQYIYLAHDDDYWTKIYLKHIEQYKSVMHGIILEALKGRKKAIAPIPSDLLDYLFNYAQEGILFDFKNLSFYDGKTVVTISKLGKHENYDEVYDVFNRKKHFTNISIELVYNNRNKKWKLLNKWK